VDRVNLASELGTILEWSAIFHLSWRRGPLGVATAVRYTPSYDDAAAGVRVHRKVASQTLLDLQGSVDFSRLVAASSHFAGLRLAVGATNVTDEEPRFAFVGDAIGFDMSRGDLKQRAYYLLAEKKFE
jgi:outer membrane receptor protein involved in Fe transport